MSFLGRRGRTLTLVSLASLGWAFSFGLGASLASLWLRDAGRGAWTIGLNTTCYYLGAALVAPLVPRWMGRANRACVLGGLLLDAAATTLFPLVSGDVAWHGLRLLCGIGTALCLVPMETLVNGNAPPQRRARDFGVYAFCVALGIGLGSVVGLTSYPLAPRLAFAGGGLVTLLAAPLALLAIPSSMAHRPEAPANAPLPWRDSALSLGTAWAQGFLEGGSITFLSIYLLGIGYGESGAGLLMGGLFAGVVAAQLPLAWLADRLGRQRVLLGCHAALLAGLGAVPCLRAALPLAAWLFVLGACCGALYPLGLSLLGERLPASSLARGNAWYLASNCAGSLTGPLVMGVVIEAFGPRAQFTTAAAAVAAVLLADRLLRREPLRPVAILLPASPVAPGGVIQ
ncbi:MAG: MFS transporter [Gemmataceae bacterium]